MAGVAHRLNPLNIHKTVLSRSASDMAAVTAHAGGSLLVRRLPARQEQMPVAGLALAPHQAAGKSRVFHLVTLLGDPGMAFQTLIIADRCRQNRRLHCRPGEPVKSVARANQLGVDAPAHPRPRMAIDAARGLAGMEGGKINCVGGG